ncbi:MAG: hypothetical protein LBP19_03600 [Treponema sp.]|jgi:uncharacterized protein YutE (UPF0331/DUF86 family)|nr:hypothetical protein [Treponema sp.]
MEDIEDYSILGINIGGGKKSPSIPTKEKQDDSSFYMGVLGGALLGFSLGHSVGLFDSVSRDKMQEIIIDIEKRADLTEKLRHIKRRIESDNAIDVYGGILILFSELEKFIDVMYTTYIRGYNKPETCKEKIYALELKGIISSVESDILRNKIYPKRNLISHGNYQQVDKRDVRACYDGISQFITKYYPSTVGGKRNG